MSYRLLTEEEIAATRHYNPTTNGCYCVDERAIAKAQDRKSIAARDKEWREKIEKYKVNMPKDPFDFNGIVIISREHLQELLSEMESK